jgi:16S rRNA G966 N2-methylase RsmD
LELCATFTPTVLGSASGAESSTATTAWAEWDEELLSLELFDLKNLDFDLGLTGFEDEELAQLLAAQDAADGLTDEDDVPELPETPISLAGDLWILGDHKLLVGDAADTGAVAKLMAGTSADLVFTDPPYNVNYEGYTEDRLRTDRKEHPNEQQKVYWHGRASGKHLDCGQ